MWRVTWPIHTCDMTHLYVWHNFFICVAWLIHSRDMTHSHAGHASFICVILLIHVCDMTHSYVCHDSWICVPWLIHMCNMTHSYVQHDSFICVTWHIHMRDMTTHIYARHESCVCLIWLTHETWLTRMRDLTHSYVQHDSLVCVTWLIYMRDMTIYMYIRTKWKSCTLCVSQIHILLHISGSWPTYPRFVADRSAISPFLSCTVYPNFNFACIFMYSHIELRHVTLTGCSPTQHYVYERKAEWGCSIFVSHPFVDVRWLIPMCDVTPQIQNIVSFIRLFCKRNLYFNRLQHICGCDMICSNVWRVTQFVLSRGVCSICVSVTWPI